MFVISEVPGLPAQGMLHTVAQVGVVAVEDLGHQIGTVSWHTVLLVTSKVYLQLGALDTAESLASISARTFTNHGRGGVQAGITVARLHLLAGEPDRVIAPELGQAIAETMPHARLERLPAAGHMLPLETPERVAQVIAELARGRTSAVVPSMI